MIIRKIKYTLSLLLPFAFTIMHCSTSRVNTSESDIQLKGSNVVLSWQKGNQGWQISQARVSQKGNWVNLDAPSGEYTLLYSAAKPDTTPVNLFDPVHASKKNYTDFKYDTKKTWIQGTTPVAMNVAGEAIHFFPSAATFTSNNNLRFNQEMAVASINAEWKLDPIYKSDVVVELTLIAKKDGYYSLASPTLATVPEKNLTWGILPGYFQGKELQKDFLLAYGYGQGIPDKPVVVRERTATTLSPLLSSSNGVTIAVIPNPGLSRDPWEKDKMTHSVWQLGLSLMNRKSELSPTMYYPVLGQKGSFLKAGQQIKYGFRYTLQASDWFDVYKHAIYDIYRLNDFLSLKETKQSLTERLNSMHSYLVDDKSSLWNVVEFEGMKIGAQSYLGNVAGAKNQDAIKNSDYGAMWMLANSTKDPLLLKGRLPYARNFKLKQQDDKPGFFQGAAIGQYYLMNSKRFVEEWGSHVEPISLTYYTMLDMGNILLFEPNDKELVERLRLGADRLLAWQKPAGNWEVAYDHKTQEPTYTDLQDLRPTFYGLVVAYRILGDKKYLDAARLGADWFIKNAVDKGHFLGVCGDTRLVNDFATGQSAQALLDLYDFTNEPRYRYAAIEAARIYTASIYTHPIPTTDTKLVNGIPRKEWQISQVGLSFEHGGAIGSAATNGPILLASHAGLFLRISQLTREPLYRDLARAAAWGRDAFVNDETSVASYYYNAMNAGAGKFPHHAWWQIGWVTDYLIAEVTLRSNNLITFPRGFVTPKVGAHQTYGFAPGKIFGEIANLSSTEGLLSIDKPQVDYIVAKSTDTKKAFVIFLNNHIRPAQTKLSWGDKSKNFKNITIKNYSGKTISKQKLSSETVLNLDGYGLQVVELK
ncbi:MAG TPA: hypothetical protein VNI52_14705 [Sphingobacteriaceae bacterium]|nr:hypothetical protein [Sphingobacteriaceae bacterium]